MIVHVQSDITKKIDCGARLRTSWRALAIGRRDYLEALHRNNVVDMLKLTFGESARLCRRCQRAA
jgi:hypothetical protein